MVIAGLIAVSGWDFLQLSRQIPPLAPANDRADLIRVNKSERTLTLLRDSQRTGSVPVGHKTREGDGRTPEGRYIVDSRNGRSRFHLALHISYPDARDRDTARQRSVSPGGDIMIHGLPNGLGFLGRLHQHQDWTDGCIAVTDAEIEEIWARVTTGTPIEILP